MQKGSPSIKSEKTGLEPAITVKLVLQGMMFNKNHSVLFKFSDVGNDSFV